MATNMNDSIAGSSLNSFQKNGIGSRLDFNTDKLVALGWTMTVRESSSGGRKRTIASFIDPSGKKFKSGKDVERHLKENGLWENVQNQNEDITNHSGDQEEQLTVADEAVTTDG